MSEPVVFKRSLPIAFLTVLRTLAPPIVAIGMLAGIARAFGVAFQSHFMMLSVLLAILSPGPARWPASSSVGRCWPRCKS